MKTKKIYRCELCGNMFGVIQDSGITPVCCGQEMKILEAGVTDAAQEKHVPVIVRDGKNVTVKVGSVEHPMTAEHYIQWILVQQNGKYQRVELTPECKPEATFVVDCAESPIIAMEYCNLHGLWQAEG